MKTKVIYIYGAPAVGKFTTAKALSEITDFKVSHNHLSTDLVRSIFERGNLVGDMLIVKIRFEILEAAVKENVKGIIITGAHAHDYIYPNGENDDWYAQQLELITEKYGGEFYGVQLTTSTDILRQRVIENDRLKWGKIHNTEVLNSALQKNDFTKAAPLKNNIIIDNTNMSAQIVATKIVDHISISNQIPPLV